MGECNCKHARARATAGQATLEYAVCLLVFTSLVAALAALWGASRDGTLLELACSAASHTPTDLVGFAQDFALF